MNTSELPFLSAGDLSRLIQSKEVSPVEATEAYLDRIASLDHRFNSYLTVMREQALADAQQAEEDIASGQHKGPMHGVPVAVKDQFWSKGVRSTGGSRILADFVPGEDATVIANLRKAGAVVLGKYRLLHRRFQQWFGRGHGGLPLRHVAGRRHRRLHPVPRHLVRAGWIAA